MSTSALVLAAGQGTRLRPITNDRPKCLVPLQGRTMLERQVEVLRAEGIETIAVATGYRGDQIELLGFDVYENPAFASTNMVESLFCARRFFENTDDDLIISYGDIVYERRNLRTLLECKADIALMVDLNWRKLWTLRQENPLDDAETLLMNDDGLITELGKKPESYDQVQGQYTGLIKLSGAAKRRFTNFYDSLDRTALYDGKDFQNMYMTSFLQGMIDNGWPVKASPVHGGWLEVDTTDDLALYDDLAARSELSMLCQLD